MAKYSIVHSVRVCTEFVPETYGRLTTIGPVFLLTSGAKRAQRQVCECACGNTVVIRVKDRSLVSSCGCLARQQSRSRMTTHGKYGSPEYTAWREMKKRCTNKAYEKYAYYGGRGIGYCERWKKFENFFADMGEKPSPKHTLEREDNDGNYEPDNCRWADKRDQANNRKSNRLITYMGETRTLAQWAGSHPLGKLIKFRISAGWDVDRAFSQVKQKRHGQ